MSQNHRLPSPDCTAFAPFLPLASHDLLSEEKATALRAHLAICTSCRAELATYDQAEAALRRVFALSQGASAPLSWEDIMHTLKNHAERPAPSAPPAPPPKLPQHKRRRFFAGFPALAAALVVVLLAVAIFRMAGLLPRRGENGGIPIGLSKITLLSISMSSAAEGWAVGTTDGDHPQGVLVHYQRGKWTAINNPYDTGILRGVFMLSDSDGWIVGDKGTILHYSSGRWIKVNSPVSTALGSIYMTSPTEGWAVGDAILRYQNSVWTPVSTPAHDFFLFSITAPSWAGGWAVGGAGTIMHYNNGLWKVVTPVPHIDLYGLAMIASNEGWAVGSGGSAGNILHYQDGQWQVARAPDPQAALGAITMVSADEGWAVGHDRSGTTGYILHYLNGRWLEVPSPTRVFLLGITMVSSTEGWAVGSQGTILHYLNNQWSVSAPIVPARTVTPASLDLTRFILNSISMVSPDEGWAVGVTRLHTASASDTLPEYGDPVILHYSQGQWRPVPFPSDSKSHIGCSATGIACPAISLNSISMLSATDGWVVGNSVLPPNVDGLAFGVVLHYTGGKWVFDRPLGSRLSSVFMRTASDGWIVGEDGNGGAPVFHYDGSAWTPVNDPAFASVLPQTIFALSATNVWLDGTNFSGSGFDGDAPEVILHYDGSRWSQQSTDLANSRIYSMAMISPDEGWAVGSLSGGTGPHPAHPEKALVEHYYQGRWQQVASFDGPPGDYLYSLYGIAMVSADEGWAVGSDGLIVHDLNGVWARSFSLTGQTLRSIVMLSPTEGWAVGDQGTILHYSKGAWGLY